MQMIDFTTQRLSVRPWTDDDAEWYVSTIDDEIIRFTREPADLTMDLWTRARQMSARSETVKTAAILDGDGALVGNVGIRSLGDGRFEFVYWIARTARGRGYATEVLRVLESWSVEHLSAAHLELHIHPANLASVAVAEKAGYVFSEFQGSDETCADELGRVAVYTRDISAALV